MNFLEQALQNVGRNTNELLEHPPILPRFNEVEIQQRIIDLENILIAGGEYLNKNDQVVIDSRIQDLENKIKQADTEADISILKEELDEYLFKKNSADIQEESFQEKQKLEKKLKNFHEENRIISN